jgi:hypothetical protein
MRLRCSSTKKEAIFHEPEQVFWEVQEKNNNDQLSINTYINNKRSPNIWHFVTKNLDQYLFIYLLRNS